MNTIDLLRPTPRLSVAAPAAIAELTAAFNAMLDRLEAERALSAARALSAQESERRRIAQELHDEVGQTLTAVLLELKSTADHAPASLRVRLHEVAELARGSLDEIRRIARRLRPGVLDELGLATGLRALADEVADHTGLAVRCEVDEQLGDLGEDAELVVYRVAQECLTNAARHARAGSIDVALRSSDAGARLDVRDDGVGVGGHAEGAGIRGMRERALLAGAALTIGPAPGGGTHVRLQLPRHPGDTP
jgi:two-component system sensor histidine kinase UhpB